MWVRLIYIHSSFEVTLLQLYTMEKSNIHAELYEAENRFRRSCEQIILLNSKLDDLQLRYDKARIVNHKSFRYNLRLKMATVEGVRNSYYEYACWKAETVAELSRRLADFSMDSENEEEAVE